MTGIPTATLERWLRILIDAGEVDQAEHLRREIFRREA